MTASLHCLMGFVYWTVFLVLCVATVRISQVATGKAASGDFPAGEKHGGDMYWRLNRAHANCLENLPIFAAVVLVAAAIGYGSDLFDNLARVFVFARVGQSLVHIASASEAAMSVRMAMYGTQVVCVVWMALQLSMG